MPRLPRRKYWLVLIALGLILLSPPARLWESVAVMAVFSQVHQADSLMTQEDIRLTIPGGLSTPEADWFPLVMTFCPGDGFARFAGRAGAKLTILYNFPAFSLTKGCSQLFNPDSPYYNSFYGAYLVQCPTGPPFGFTQDREGTLLPDPAALAVVPQYDFQRLVLADFGPHEPVFQWALTDAEERVSYAGWEGWTRFDATLTVNGAAHNPTQFVQSYLQYGAPAWETDEPLAPVDMSGRLYLRYFPQWDVSFCFYILARDPAVLETCDRDILSKSRLEDAG